MSTEIELNSSSNVADVQQALEALEDPRIRAVNEKHGDDYGVNILANCVPWPRP